MRSLHSVILDALQSQTALLDEQGTIIYVNKAWVAFSKENGMPEGYSTCGSNYCDLCESALGEVACENKIAKGIKSVLNQEASEFFCSYPSHSPNQKSWFQLRVTPLTFVGKHWVIVTHENVTELERARQYQSHLFHMVSHDLKLPLSSFISYANFFNDQGELPSADDTLEIMEQFRKASLHMLSIVHNMLDLGKIEFDELSIVKNSESLSKVVQESVEMLKPLYVNKVPVSCRTLAGLNDEVFIDVNKIRQVLINLLGNAIKFTKEGYIEICIEMKEDMLFCHVRDTGCGVPADKLDIIFKMYGQAHKGGGTGLGLSISSKIIEMHGGTLSATSEVGKGSTFSFTLPRLEKA